MKRDNKKALYESIMSSIAREVKKALNENTSNKSNDYENYFNKLLENNKDISKQPIITNNYTVLNYDYKYNNVSYKIPINVLYKILIEETGKYYNVKLKDLYQMINMSEVSLNGIDYMYIFLNTNIFYKKAAEWSEYKISDNLGKEIFFNIFDNNFENVCIVKEFYTVNIYNSRPQKFYKYYFKINNAEILINFSNTQPIKELLKYKIK